MLCAWLKCFYRVCKVVLLVGYNCAVRMVEVFL